MRKPVYKIIEALRGLLSVTYEIILQIVCMCHVIVECASDYP